METGEQPRKRRWSVLKIIALSLAVVVIAVGVFLYYNYNRLLSRALRMSFESSLMADVYELKFENLRVNLVDKSIKVINVSLLPREKPLQNHPYINSFFRLTTENLSLEGVDLRTLLRSQKLILKRILILQPEIDVTFRGMRHIMLPFGDTTRNKETEDGGKKRAFDSFILEEFQLVGATFHTRNEEKQREFEIQDLDISLRDVELSSKPGEYYACFSQVTLAIEEFKAQLKKGPIKEADFTDFKIAIDSPAIHYTLDTAIYRLHDFRAGFSDLDIQTANATFHMAVKSFDLAYRNESINLRGVSFKPNVSHAELQKDFDYQHTEFSGSIGSLDFRQISFDSLLYAQSLYVEEILLNDVKASVYKDKTKPMDTTRLPIYLGQTVAGIQMPIHIKQVKATNVQLDNTERKPDSTIAKAQITRAKLEVRNTTNLSAAQGLMVKADAWLMDKSHFNVSLTFSYRKPQFSFKGIVDTFNLPDLNPLIGAYTPASINKGVSDNITFSGVAEETKANGTLKFLYHDLEVDLKLQDQARWKSAVIAFAANTLLQSSNPPSSKLPPREVEFHVERDMHKGGMNLVIRSILYGLKETMIMSKENRKTYQEEKKKAKGEPK